MDQPDSTDLPAVITPALLAFVRQRFILGPHSIHGPDHWLRVWENGRRLAELNGADQEVVALFAFTHDMARADEGADWQHGPRAARIIQHELSGRLIHLPPDRLSQLIEAVHGHTEGHCRADLTVQTCWDADRLDLGRAGIRPDPRRLCTTQARDPLILQWANQRSNCC